MILVYKSIRMNMLHHTVKYASVLKVHIQLVVFYEPNMRKRDCERDIFDIY